MEEKRFQKVIQCPQCISTADLIILESKAGMPFVSALMILICMTLTWGCFNVNSFLFGGSFGFLRVISTFIFGLLGFLGACATVVMIRSYYGNEIIGHYLFKFFIGTNRHFHRTDPTTKGDPWYEPFQEQRDPCCLKLRCGGFFKKSEVLGWAGKYWRIVPRIRATRDVVIIPVDESLYNGEPIGPMKPDRALDIVMHFENLKDLVDTGIRPSAMEGARNTLIDNIAHLLALMEVHRDTMGNSKHAQRIREYLEWRVVPFIESQIGTNEFTRVLAQEAEKVRAERRA